MTARTVLLLTSTVLLVFGAVSLTNPDRRVPEGWAATLMILFVAGCFAAWAWALVQS